MKNSLLKKYAKLIVKSGVALKKGQNLVISADIESAPLVRAVTECAYKAGARKVIVKWGDEAVSKLHFTHCAVETLSAVKQYEVDERNEWADERTPFVAIVSDDPMLYDGLDSNKISASARARAVAFKRWRDGELAGEFHWSIVAYPSKAWAKKVFPNLSERVAVNKLGECIAKAVRLDTANPIRAWQEHSARLSVMCEKLNNLNLKSLHYSNSAGTDFTIEMPDNYEFMGGSEMGKDGKLFNANMPTEEIFSAPHRDSASGVVYATLPLARSGKVIEDFWFKFERGVVVDYGAREGLDVLKNIIETDEGSKRLGEVALVPFNSPIQNMGILFYETLFDENASCHLALGGAYASSVRGGSDMSEEQRISAGLNESAEHVDFMVGSPDLSIVGVTKSGERVNIFVNGNFAI